MAQNLSQDAILSEVSSNCTPERVGRPGIVLDVQPSVFLGLGRHVASVEIRPKVYGI